MSQTMIEQQRDFLHEILCNIDGVKEVYYQPPNNTMLVYPCLIYTMDYLDITYADGKRYLSFPQYTLTLIDYDPESIIQRHILDLDADCHVSFNRFFTSDNLNHWVYKLVYTKALW